MAAPTPAQIQGFIDQSFQQRGSGGNQFFDTLTKAISDGWSTWEKGLSFGGLIITGAGAGAWSGSGTGGVMQGPPYQLPPVTFDNQAKQQTKMVDGLAKVLPAFMTNWVTTFKFSSLAFTGTSTATASNPGTADANNAPTPLSTAGQGKTPSQALTGQKLADQWLATLTPPDFNVSAPQGKTKDLINAISGAIEQAFDTIWLINTQATGNLFSGAAAPAGAVSGLASTTNGKLS